MPVESDPKKWLRGLSRWPLKIGGGNYARCHKHDLGFSSAMQLCNDGLGGALVFTIDVVVQADWLAQVQ